MKLARQMPRFPARIERKAISWPSGDHTGYWFSNPFFVTWIGSPPTTGLTHISTDPDFLDANAIIRESGEKLADAMLSVETLLQLVIGTVRIGATATPPLPPRMAKSHHPP